MSIIVYWMESTGQPAHAVFGQNELLAALKFSEERRREGKRHVTISSELDDRVGSSGVQAVEGGRLPDGEVYDFSKAHRGAGPSSSGRR